MEQTGQGSPEEGPESIGINDRGWWPPRAASCCGPCAAASGGLPNHLRRDRAERVPGLPGGGSGGPLRAAGLHRPPGGGNGFELARLARELHPRLHSVVLAQGDAIPAECSYAPWLEALVSEANCLDERPLLQAAVMAILGVNV
jgi:hypothetical protein